VNHDPAPRFLGRARFYRHVLRGFKRGVEDGSVLLCTDSDQTKKEYELLCYVPFVELPTPRLGPPHPKATVGSPITFASLGPPRAEKGAAELIQAVDRIRSMDLSRPARFLIQWPGDFTDEDGCRIQIPDSWSSDARIEIVRRFYDSSEYERVMQRCDCLLLPYRWSDYFNRISAVQVEAASAGIPTIVVENTWLHRAMTKYGAGLVCGDRNPESLAKTIAEACDKIDQLTRTAQLRRTAALAHHSPERFLQLLWGLSDPVQ
jgi:glycosyltransferase involved in cell wall biosynthesis